MEELACLRDSYISGTDYVPGSDPDAGNIPGNKASGVLALRRALERGETDPNHTGNRSCVDREKS